MTDLKDKKINYTFDTWEDYDDLMRYLEDEGVTWIDGTRPTQWKRFDNLFNNIHRILLILRNGKLTYVDGWDASFCLFKDFEKIHWKKGQKIDISLAEFLGWEEGVKYRRNGNICKVDANHLKVLKNGTHWKNAYIETWRLVDLRSATKFKPKYMIKTPFVSSRGTQYLSKEKGKGDAFFAAKLNSADVIQEFTKEEADKLVREYKLDNITEIVEVVE